MLILNSYLSYPDDYLANNHRYANKLGRLDLSAEERLRVAGQDSFVRENMKETRIIKCHSEVTNILYRPVDAVVSSFRKKTSQPVNLNSIKSCI